MKAAGLIEHYKKRLTQVLDESWKIFKLQFTCDRNNAIDNEAQFQHYFAQILKSVGDLYSLYEDDIFQVKLEAKSENVAGKTENGKKRKYIDITCRFINKSLGVDYSCAIELKFKTKEQGAPNNGRVYVYQDLEALEAVVEKGEYNTGRFYMITDYKLYTENREQVLSGINLKLIPILQ